MKTATYIYTKNQTEAKPGYTSRLTDTGEKVEILSFHINFARVFFCDLCSYGQVHISHIGIEQKQ